MKQQHRQSETNIKNYVTLLKLGVPIKVTDQIQTHMTSQNSPLKTLHSRMVSLTYFPVSTFHSTHSDPHIHILCTYTPQI